MMNRGTRRLPVGIQSFVEIRRCGYLYVDKTDIVWKLVNGVKFNYLSRPRRFGKSVLVDTLRAYFEGRRELFEGLKIMQYEKEWKQYSVIRLDMSRDTEPFKADKRSIIALAVELDSEGRGLLNWKRVE